VKYPDLTPESEESLRGVEKPESLKLKEGRATILTIAKKGTKKRCDKNGHPPCSKRKTEINQKKWRNAKKMKKANGGVTELTGRGTMTEKKKKTEGSVPM